MDVKCVRTDEQDGKKGKNIKYAIIIRMKKTFFLFLQVGERKDVNNVK